MKYSKDVCEFHERHEVSEHLGLSRESPWEDVEFREVRECPNVCLYSDSF